MNRCLLQLPGRLLIAGALLVCFSTSHAQSGGNGRDRRFHRSDEIEDQLGEDLPDVAADYRMTEGELRNTLRRDRSLRSDDAGALHYACAGLVVQKPQAAGTSTTSSGTVAAGPFPDAQTFLLHSRPTSTKKIYLDFTGNTTTGTSWNSSYTAGAAISTPTYDIDGVPTSFSSAELSRIQLIWQRVVEDFSAFDVDVTTEDPGLEGLRKTSSTDNAYGVRVCIGGSSSDWFGAGAGGVAYVGSFNWNSDTPCFIFTAQLGSGDEKYTAEAISHEVGHTLGLTHDGQTNGTEYYAGHGNWAPIMGVGYYKEVVQWSKGEYSLANNLQDDLSVMQTYGATLIADNVGNSLTTATPLAGSSFNVSSLITARTDVDVFSFNTGAGTVSFNAATAIPSPDLDVQLSLYNSAGTLVTSANPVGLPGALTATVPAGTYYLAVDGVGTGDPTTAYNDYASIGQYTLTGTAVTSTNVAPVAVVSSSTPTSGLAPLAVNFSSAGSYDSDGTIASYDWDFGDGTPHSNLPNPAHSYASAGTFIATLIVTDNGGLSANAKVTITVSTPAATVFVASIDLSKSTSRKGTSVTAIVTVKNSNGNVVPNATVSGSWSGVVSGSTSSYTDRRGQAAFGSSRINSQGTEFFTVTGITVSGGTYNASKNVETTDSIIVP